VQHALLKVEGGGRELPVRIARDHMEIHIRGHLEALPISEIALHSDQLSGWHISFIDLELVRRGFTLYS
jgi:hypothetical protein